MSKEVKEEKSDENNEIMILPSLGTIVERLVLFIEFNIVFWLERFVDCVTDERVVPSEAFITKSNFDWKSRRSLARCLLLQWHQLPSIFHRIIFQFFHRSKVIRCYQICSSKGATTLLPLKRFPGRENIRYLGDVMFLVLINFLMEFLFRGKRSEQKSHLPRFNYKNLFWKRLSNGKLVEQTLFPSEIVVFDPSIDSTSPRPVNKHSKPKIFSAAISDTLPIS